MVDLYHATDREGMEGIIKDSKINSPAYFTPNRSNAEDYGEYVFELDLPTDIFEVDQESYTGDDVEEALEHGVSVFSLQDVEIGTKYRIYTSYPDEDDEFRKFFY